MHKRHCFVRSCANMPNTQFSMVQECVCSARFVLATPFWSPCTSSWSITQPLLEAVGWGKGSEPACTCKYAYMRVMAFALERSTPTVYSQRLQRQEPAVRALRQDSKSKNKRRSLPCCTAGLKGASYRRCGIMGHQHTPHGTSPMKQVPLEDTQKVVSLFQHFSRPYI